MHVIIGGGYTPAASCSRPRAAHARSSVPGLHQPFLLWALCSWEGAQGRARPQHGVCQLVAAACCSVWLLPSPVLPGACCCSCCSCCCCACFYPTPPPLLRRSSPSLPLPVSLSLPLPALQCPHYHHCCTNCPPPRSLWCLGHAAVPGGREGVQRGCSTRPFCPQKDLTFCLQMGSMWP